MDAPEIRVATFGETDTIVEHWVALATGQREYDSHIVADANRSQIREAVVHHIASDSLLVAETDEIVGFVMFTVESGTYEQDSQRGVVENLYVRPDHRNEGIGSRLLDVSERRLAARGVDHVALQVMARNDSARQFYRDNGFAPHRIELEKRIESDTHSKGDE